MNEHTNSTSRGTWRSLEEAQGVVDVESFAAAEFPTAWDAADSGHARRDFLRVMGASMGLAGLGACVVQPEEKILPYIKQPEHLIPGKARYYATTFMRGGYGVGVLAESHMGRPTHLEGNPLHPASLGGLDGQALASVLGLWDPDRSKRVVRRGKPATWGLFVDEVMAEVSNLDGKGGEGLSFLALPSTSPTFGKEVAALKAKLPRAKWHQWTPVNRDAVYAGTEIAFGKAHDLTYDFTKAKVILAVDADLGTDGPGNIAYSKQVAAPRKEGKAGNRIYAVESSPTGLGAMADHRYALRGSEMGSFLLDLAHALGVIGAATGDSALSSEAAVIAADLRSAGKSAAVVVGDHLPGELHALALAINQRLGSIGTTVLPIEPIHVEATSCRASLEALVADMNGGKVEMLVVLGGNPVYDAPADLGFVEAFEKVPMRVHASLAEDETARLSHWHLPLSHYLESWGDARAYEGTTSIVQPLIAPLYDTRSALEVLAMFTGKLDAKGADLVQEYWGETFDDYDTEWPKALRDGVVAGSKAAVVSAVARPEAGKVSAPEKVAGLEVVLRPCPNVYDGSFANNAWLQETPRPVSRVVWDNAVYMSKSTADALKVKNDDVVRVTVGSATVEGSAWVLPGTAKESLTIHLGYGRKEGGKVLAGAGFDAYPLSGASGVLTGATVEKTKRTYEVVTVQDHWSLEGRNHVRQATKSEYAANAGFAQAPKHHVLPISMYPETEYPGRAWGMVIDLSACNGCNACMVACQSENNIAVVGKDQVGKGREMHWIRIDRYYQGDIENPDYVMQPTTCMHCERAPCEPVCPANATMHGPEGINQMVYNRCVGTRYCSNNCPYKVRRFNFLLYSDFETESLKGQRNPDVSIRSRGVMEKCTYCIQRIKQVTIEAKVAGTVKDDHGTIPDGEIQVACQSACPSGCITFGDINDPKSEVTRLKATKLNYTVLEEINTAPRTSYLAAVTNPNPKVAPAAPATDAHHHDGGHKVSG